MHESEKKLLDHKFVVTLNAWELAVVIGLISAGPDSMSEEGQRVYSAAALVQKRSPGGMQGLYDKFASHSDTAGELVKVALAGIISDGL